MSGAWIAQQRRTRTGERFGVIDRHQRLSDPFHMPCYFPETFVAIDEEDIVNQKLQKWDLGNYWLRPSNEFYRTRVPGFFERVPADIQAKAAQLRASEQPNKARILIHVLHDAKYNDRRNWSRRDADALIAKLRYAGCQVVLLNPAKGSFSGNFDDMLAQLLAADAFIGGDTGPSHVFAMLCPDKPQLAIYPDMTNDRQTFEAERLSLHLPLQWNSLPFRLHLAVMELKPKRKLIWNGARIKRVRYGRFNPTDAAKIMLSLLYARMK
jgi:hypothetical protein